MEILKKNPAFSIIIEPIWRGDSGEHQATTGNFIEIFLKNYLDVLMGSMDIPPDVLSAEKLRLIEGMVIPECQRIRDGAKKMSVDGVAQIIHDYYAEEPYYPEVVAALKQVLGDAYR